MIDGSITCVENKTNKVVIKNTSFNTNISLGVDNQLSLTGPSTLNLSLTKLHPKWLVVCTKVCQLSKLHPVLTCPYLYFQ